MPWSTPTLATVRKTNRDYIVGRIGQPLIPNDYPRILADANAGNAHLNLQYLDWLATQLLPDTAETQFLDKWGKIFLVNADGSRGRKVATYAAGTATITATIAGTVLPAGSILTALSGAAQLAFQTTADVSVAGTPSPVPLRALNAGAAANLAAGSPLALSAAIPGISSGSGLVASLSGGADQETDDELRVRVLARIRQPPMGGAAYDYENWALAVAGVTRAWCAPGEMGVGTVTIRFMCDDLRATGDRFSNGFPLQADLDAVKSFVDSVRPVTVKDFFVVAPVPQPVDFTIANLVTDTPATRQAIVTSVTAMLALKAKPAFAVQGVLQPPPMIQAQMVSASIRQAVGVSGFDLVMADAVMPNNGCMPVLGSISYA